MKRWTQLIHSHHRCNDPYHANSVPIYQTATFAQRHATQQNEYDYSRSGNPTRSVVEQHLAQLEGAKYAMTFSSGMAAITTITRLLSQGDHIVAGNDLYGGSHRLLSRILSKQGIQTTWVDSADLSALEQAINERTRIVLVETPSNPLQSITDLSALAEKVHRRGVLLVIDNSLMSPWLQQPLSLGADIVIHSATKHLGGHGDLTAGVIATNDADLAEELDFIRNAEGSALAPFECWLLHRGVKTLGLRIEREQLNAQKIVDYLLKEPTVTKLYYPGLESHPGYQIHQRQAKGSGNMISFETQSLDFSRDLVEATQLFTISVSFGSLQSLISLPCWMSHASIPDEKRTLASDLVRLSVGIEDPDDLIDDLKQAFKTAKK